MIATSSMSIAAEPGGWCFDNQAVQYAITVLERSQVLSALRAWRAEERERLGCHAGGAPERFPAQALWTAMILAALHGRPMLATTFCDILFRRISPAIRARLGLPDPPHPDDKLAWDALYRCVRYRLHRLLDVIDPSPLPKNRRLDPEAFEWLVARRRSEMQLTDAVLARRAERLAWVQNALLDASLSVLPREVRRRWRGSVAVDATPVPAFSRADQRVRGTGPRAKRAVVQYAADPDADLYLRTDTPDGSRGRAGEPRVRRLLWSYEASLVVAGTDNPTTDALFPPLVVGMAPLHRPGTAVGPNAITALASVAGRGHPTGWLAADRAYTNTVSGDFQLPARALGYRPVLDYRVDQLGVQGSYAGALLIEGAFYCPAIPTALINATIDYRAGRIDETTWRNRIHARRAFRLRPKTKPDAEGHVRNLCPASDGAPTGRCPLKPRSVERTTSATMRIPVTDDLLANPPDVCTQQSVTFPPTAGAKLAQTLHYGSTKWAATYHTLRNTIEGMNGIAKDGAYAALGDPSRRRIRGVAAQSIFTALLLTATNIAAISSFVRQALPDAGGTLRRPRRRRTTPPVANWAPTVATRGGAPPP